MIFLLDTSALLVLYRKELFPTLYNENEGVERLFHTNQLLIASNFFEAGAARPTVKFHCHAQAS